MPESSSNRTRNSSRPRHRHQPGPSSSQHAETTHFWSCCSQVCGCRPVRQGRHRAGLCLPRDYLHRIGARLPLQGTTPTCMMRAPRCLQSRPLVMQACWVVQHRCADPTLPGVLLLPFLPFLRSWASLPPGPGRSSQPRAPSKAPLAVGGCRSPCVCWGMPPAPLSTAHSFVLGPVPWVCACQALLTPAPHAQRATLTIDLTPPALHCTVLHCAVCAAARTRWPAPQRSRRLTR